MRTLDYLRKTGYAAAESFSELPSDYFAALAVELYPKNLHRRGWALNNLKLFYVNRKSELEIRGKNTSGQDVGEQYQQLVCDVAANIFNSENLHGHCEVFIRRMGTLVKSILSDVAEHDAKYIEDNYEGQNVRRYINDLYDMFEESEVVQRQLSFALATLKAAMAERE